MQKLVGHRREVRTVVYAPDGRLVSGGADKRVIVWDSASREAVETIKAGGVVYATAVSPDGKRLAFAGRASTSPAEENAIPLYDLEAYQPAGEFVWPAEGRAVGSIWSLSFSADGRYLAGASRVPGAGGSLNGSRARWWDCRAPFHGTTFPDDRVFAVGFAPAGGAVALTREGSVAVFDAPGGQERLNYRLQCAWAAAVAFVPGESTLIVAASSYLHFVDLANAARPKRIKTGFRTITSVAVSRDGGLLLVSGRPDTLEFYDVKAREPRTSLDFGLGTVHAAAFSPDGCTFAVGGEGGLMVCDVP
jgi:WD40 repeat protein